MQFKYNYLQNTLLVQNSETWVPITKTFTTNWGSPGFILEPDSHWITFTIYPDKIRTFYKQVQIPSQEHIWKLQDLKYYQKDLPKEELQSNESSFSNDMKMNQRQTITFTFTPQDEVHKINGIWVKKQNN